MVAAHALALVLSIAGAGDTVLLEFTADWCGACKATDPTVRRLIADGYPIQQINVDRNPQQAANYRVTLVPCFVLVVDGREVNRTTGGASYAQLAQLLASAGGRSGNPAQSQSGAQSQMGAQGQIAAPTQQTIPAGSPNPLAAQPRQPIYPVPGSAAPNNPNFANNGPPTNPPVRPQVSQPMNAPATVPVSSQSMAQASARPAAATVQVDAQTALQATVRIHVEDPAGQSVGTGTVIDTHDGEALVITCGHLFRDSKGKGIISVDLFAGGTSQTVRGQLVGFDLERDLGLISIVPSVEIRPVRVAPRGFAIQRGDTVFSVGCNHGADPTVMASQVTAIDKYLGAPNFEVAGQPVEGRSGGGLFSRDGMLVGICNAADPTDKEGIYAGLTAIQWQLDQIGQRAVYDRQQPRPLMAGDSRQVGAIRKDAPPPEMPVAMADSRVQPASNAAPIPNLTQVANTAPVANIMPIPSANPAGGSLQVPGAPPISNASVTVNPADSELICIIRPRNQAQGNDRLFILSQPSPELLQQVMRESRPFDAQRMPAEIKLQAVSEPQGPAAWSHARTGPSPDQGNVVRAQSADR